MLGGLFGPLLSGCGSKLNRRGYAGFGPCFHLPGQPIFGYRVFEPQPSSLTVGSLKTQSATRQGATPGCSAAARGPASETAPAPRPAAGVPGGATSEASGAKGSSGDKAPGPSNYP